MAFFGHSLTEIIILCSWVGQIIVGGILKQPSRWSGNDADIVI